MTESDALNILEAMPEDTFQAFFSSLPARVRLVVGSGLCNWKEVLPQWYVKHLTNKGKSKMEHGARRTKESIRGSIEALEAYLSYEHTGTNVRDIIEIELDQLKSELQGSSHETDMKCLDRLNIPLI